MKTIQMPMTYKKWEKVGLPTDGKSLTSSLSLIEAEMLELIEGRREILLLEILEKMNWPEPLVLMSAGGLVREELVIAKRDENRILLVFNQAKA